MNKLRYIEITRQAPGQEVVVITPQDHTALREGLQQALGRYVWATGRPQGEVLRALQCLAPPSSATEMARLCDGEEQ